jgi:hypothetical protein
MLGWLVFIVLGLAALCLVLTFLSWFIRSLTDVLNVLSRSKSKLTSSKTAVRREAPSGDLDLESDGRSEDATSSVSEDDDLPWAMGRWTQIAAPFFPKTARIMKPFGAMTRVEDLQGLYEGARQLQAISEEIGRNVPEPPDPRMVPHWDRWLHLLGSVAEDIIEGVTVTYKLQPAADEMMQMSQEVDVMTSIILDHARHLESM